MWRRQQQALLRFLPPVKTQAAWAGGGLGRRHYGSVSAPEGRKGKAAPLQVSSHNSRFFQRCLSTIHLIAYLTRGTADAGAGHGGQIPAARQGWRWRRWLHQH